VNRFKGGIATDSDVALAQTQLQSTTAQSIDVGVARAQYEHAIATLIGVPPRASASLRNPLNLALPQLPTGVPSALLERRPDISIGRTPHPGRQRPDRHRHRRLLSRHHFERRRRLREPAHGNLFQGPSALWSIGGSAAELLFDAGRRHALTDQARHSYEQQTDNYRESVLNAFQEVEDSSPR
jgi:outer membrane protein TolC